jgi:hypothetical protein
LLKESKNASYPRSDFSDFQNDSGDETGIIYDVIRKNCDYGTKVPKSCKDYKVGKFTIDYD